ncbi:SOS response-associated peptidase [Thomasclavelia sp.]|uniref:SOS response-associated peptidase n=1 Tax=Thomasclavelia sp. TaxID=3025757 RepID=UPI0025EE7F1A|nr:SOS response-associated peptidase family protein [Thomasclavelia sp.]
MCSRYFLELKMLMELEEKIGYNFGLDLLSAKDFYPSDQIPFFIIKDKQLVAKLGTWGYRVLENKLIINARQETLFEKKLFKEDVLNHRCIIPASGFYEWDQHKHRFTFKNDNQKLMFMAGLYRNNGNNQEVTIVTTNASGVMEGIHSRMPLIFNQKQMQQWLNNENIDSLLKTNYQHLKITAGVLQTSLF